MQINRPLQRQRKANVLQSLQNQPQQSSGGNSPTPEQVKPGTVSLPSLPDAVTEQGTLEYQDWLTHVEGIVEDVSDTAAEWWEGVMQTVDQAYARWASASPIDKLRVEPVVPQELLSGRWSRVNARVCGMLLESLSKAMKADIISRKCNKSAPALLFRLHVTYQPGGGHERQVILKHLQEPTPTSDPVVALHTLRAWIRWHTRCTECNMKTPDATVLAKGLCSLTEQVLAKDGSAHFRTQLVRSMLHIDAQPSEANVLEFHKHLLAELESIASSSTTPGQVPKVRFVGGPNQPAPSSPSGGSQAKNLCRFYLGSSGCKRGKKCKFSHDMSSLSKPERAKKCFACGSEAHRQKECPVAGAGSPKGKDQGANATVPSKPSTGGVTPGADPGRDRQTLEAFMRLMYAATNAESSQSSSALVPVAVSTATPIVPATAQTPALEDKPSSQEEPRARAISLKAIEPPSDDEADVADGLQFRALVDSGATHALRVAVDQEEWANAAPVVVSLAGNATSDMRISPSGTLLMAPASAGQTIVPLGSVIQDLGYRLDWTASRCRLVAPSGRVFRLKVKGGCPELVESEALVLISKLEERKAEELKTLECNVAETASRIRAVKTSMSKGWFGHLEDYVSTGATSSAHLAVSAAPFFADVPQASLQGLVQDLKGVSGWELLKGFTHLNRRSRRTLLNAPEWIVHLYAGPRRPTQFSTLASGDVALLELDITRSADQDVLKDPAWRILVWGALNGKLSHLLGGPSCRTFSMLRHKPDGGPLPVRSPEHLYGLPNLCPRDRVLVDHDLALFCRQIWLHALATAGRKARPIKDHRQEIGFLLEQPMPPDRFLPESHELFGKVPSFWHTGLWRSYAEEAGLWEINFNQGNFGHCTEKPTTIGTNYGDLSALERLENLEGLPRKPPYKGKSSDLAEWAPGFIRVIVAAIKNWNG